MNLDNIHKGKYVPTNTQKYIGDINRITYRSSWERMFMRWCDLNPDVIMWGSEVTKIPYICGTDNELHHYYVDFTLKMKNGKVWLIEIKPEKQTQQPEKTKGKKRATFLTESLAWIKNKSKWKYAVKYAEKNNMKFEVWTEKTLKKLGIPI